MLFPSLVFLGLAHLAVSSFIEDIALGLVKCDCNRPTNLDVSQISVYMYNYNNNAQKVSLIEDAADALLALRDPNQCVHVFVPGFTNNINSEAPTDFRCAFPKITCNGQKVLGVILDQSNYTDGNAIEKLNEITLYQKAVRNSKSIGIAIGKFLLKILAQVSVQDLTLSGHSLGAPIAGYAAQVCKDAGKSLPHLWAIDAAGICFDDCVDEHVNKNQADKVLAVHCNAGGYGSKLNLCNYDFYSEDGKNQEGCTGLLNASCSHEKCVPIYLEAALRSGIWDATMCPNYQDYEADKCDNNAHTLAGYGLDSTTPEGVYYFNPDSNLQCDVGK